MPNRSSIGKKRDLNQTAFDLVDRIARKSEGEAPDEDEPKKNPAAVELGRRGGLKGGKARAEKMTEDERREAAKKAAKARWAKPKG